MENAENHTLPVFNFSSEDLPGEIWMPVVGVEKYALISQFGRVKRVGWLTVANTGAKRCYHELIYRSNIKSSYSLNDGRFKYTLTCTITTKRLKLIFNVMRMVYHQFCNPFPLEDRDYKVSAINENDLDIRPCNLRLTHRFNVLGADLSKRNKYNDDAKIQLFKNATFSKELVYRRQLISCYDNNGKRIRTFSNIFEAHLRTGHLVNEIELAIEKPFSKLGQFFWRSGKMQTIDTKLFVREQARIKKESKGIKITQFNLNGEPINYYWSLKDAAKANHITKPAILACLKGEQQAAGYFLWKEGHWEIPVSGL